MAGFDPAKAARMNQLAQLYPNAPIGTLATLARVSVSDLGNYTTDSVGTRAANANFGRVTSETSQNVHVTLLDQELHFKVAVLLLNRHLASDLNRIRFQRLHHQDQYKHKIVM